MATTMKDSDAQVTFEDQQKINVFARTNARLTDSKEELAAKEKELQNLTDAEDELMMAEGDECVPYQIGEVLVEMTMEEAQAELEKAKELCQQEIDGLKAKAEGFKDTLSELKTALYAKFGNNINLDMEEES
ncbi:prefoldin subunit 4 [Aplysia californica]|uniref:Prefoldin subunit 4 n=1 Tax=Aplysia californica TaxID=6500 RepID=A0ABM0K0E5_APLCA|nr:prefoldin subunit 4 [Aplysia californica]